MKTQFKLKLKTVIAALDNDEQTTEFLAETDKRMSEMGLIQVTFTITEKEGKTYISLHYATPENACEFTLLNLKKTELNKLAKKFGAQQYTVIEKRRMTSKQNVLVMFKEGTLTFEKDRFVKSNLERLYTDHAWRKEIFEQHNIPFWKEIKETVIAKADLLIHRLLNSSRMPELVVRQYAYDACLYIK